MTSGPVAAGAPGVEVVLRDGSTVHVRSTRPDDARVLEAFFESLSDRSRQLRFFSGGADVRAFARLAAAVGERGGYGLIATRGNGRPVAHAMYATTLPATAEVAFAVSDELQGTGVATILLAHLAEHAAAHGVETFGAEVLPENHAMVRVFRESGFPVEIRSLPGVVDVHFPTALSAAARERFEQRERTAATAAVEAVLRPRSVVVVGVSQRRGSVGRETLANLVAAGYEGRVAAVNGRGGRVAGMEAHARVTDVPGEIDLAVIATPAVTVASVARDCAAKGVRALVVLSAGFGEAGPEGVERQRELLEICRAAGMRLVGPNCLGVMNTAPDVRLNATFGPAFPPAGPIGFLSQSGALGLAIIDHACAEGIGISSFVSNGNKADISGNDLLQYWENDDATRLVALYLESFGNPRKFGRIARRVAARKPVLAVKSGRGSAGAKATGSHTGAMVSASDVTVDALFRQAGVIRTDTLSELLLVARLLASQPVPAGGRAGIVTNAGGLGILCADACEAGGLEVPELPEGVRAELASFLAPTAATANPVDMIATASADDFRRAIAALAASGAVDAIVALFIPPLVTRPEDVADALIDAAAELDERLPLLIVFASHDLPARLREPGGPPVFTYPEDAAGALVRAVEHGRWRARDPGSVPAFEDVRDEEAAAVIAGALQRGAGWLEPAEVAALLGAYGIPFAPWRIVAAVDEVAYAARAIGGPVALKAVAPGLLHKSDAGGVELGLSGRANVTAAARRIEAAVTAAGHALDGFLVQEMAPPGVEMLAGIVQDPLFGCLVACGAGGTAAELSGDVAVRLTPVTGVDAREMVESLRSYPLLCGYRGAPQADVEGLRETILRLALLADGHGEIAEVDLNPVIASSAGATVADARIRVEATAPARPWPAIGS